MSAARPTRPYPRRVAVTGMGVVAPCGVGLEPFWNGLCHSSPGDAERRVPGFDITTHLGDLNAKEARRLDRFTQFALVSAQMALDDASGGGGLHAIGVDPDRAGVIIATGVGGLETLEDQIIVRHEKGERRVSPFLVPMFMPNAASAAVSMRFGAQGPCETVTTACAAGTHGIGNAARLVATGRCDVMLAGGSEAAMTVTALAGFGNMTALSTSGWSRPFDMRRDGFVMAEAGAVLVLEELEHAQRRGARIYAEVLGSASTADAHHITAPSPGGAGALRCMEVALVDAGLLPEDIRHINAHGTSTPLNDAAEAEAVAKMFGSPGPIITSTKGVTGHALGAAGAIEAVAMAMAIDRKLIPPTRGTEQVDPDFAINLVTGEARSWEPGPSISNSFGFGGHNGSLVMAPLTW